jgi:hypothetical protein
MASQTATPRRLGRAADAGVTVTVSTTIGAIILQTCSRTVQLAVPSHQLSGGLLAASIALNEALVMTLIEFGH